MGNVRRAGRRRIMGNVYRAGGRRIMGNVHRAGRRIMGNVHKAGRRRNAHGFCWRTHFNKPHATSGTPALLMGTEDDGATMMVRQLCEIKHTVTNQVAVQSNVT